MELSQLDNLIIGNDKMDSSNCNLMICKLYYVIWTIVSGNFNYMISVLLPLCILTAGVLLTLLCLPWGVLALRLRQAVPKVEHTGFSINDN
jgi:hypothetical protein